MYADVILPVAVAGSYTYKVPDAFLSNVQVGARVVVTLKSRSYCGVILQLHNQKPRDYDVKPILELLDTESPSVLPSQLELWQWMASYYMCSLGEVMVAALPGNLRIESNTHVYLINPDYQTDSYDEQQILLQLKQSTEAKLKELSKHLSEKRKLGIFKKLIDAKIIATFERRREKYKSIKQTYVRLGDESSTEKLTEKQELLFQLFTQLSTDTEVGISKQELLSKAQLTEGVLKGLIKKGRLSTYSRAIDRKPVAYPQQLQPLYPLSDAQQKALTEIKLQHQKFATVLLHGVTSSGKTEIYTHLIAEALKRKETVLYLLPEIALTSQISSRLVAFFGKQLLIYHSKYSPNERVEIWKKLQDPDKNYLVIGARSAVFLPFSKLGLIIVDEEHENTFKQFDPAPRYHARDTAVVLAQLHKAKALLGSATPSIESYFNVHLQKYGLVELSERYKAILPPKILIADLAEAKRKKQLKYGFTPFLIEKIQACLERGEQVILFQNRRGYAYFLQCTACQEIPTCPNCDVSLTLHKYRQVLCCHYCSHTQAYEKNACKHCGNTTFDTIGSGTERIEEEVKELFPNHKIDRLDLDSATTKNGYARILHHFEHHQIDILIGTQILAKGLDFENVGLVGILQADMLLNFPDFRAFERSFQLMMQVSGRAGRKRQQGEVVIQSYRPKHPILHLVQTGNFLALYNNQVTERNTFHYPPLFRMISVMVKHREAKQTQLAANELAAMLRQSFGRRVYGAHDPLVTRISNYYQKQIILKIERKASYDKAKEILQKSINQLLESKKHGAIRVICDVDVV